MKPYTQFFAFIFASQLNALLASNRKINPARMSPDVPVVVPADVHYCSPVENSENCSPVKFQSPPGHLAGMYLSLLDLRLCRSRSHRITTVVNNS